jgi:ferritin-like metal-binding protein YciE
LVACRRPARRRGCYGSLIAYAKQLGRSDCAEVLQETLAEEKAADQKLTSIAESRVNQQAV